MCAPALPAAPAFTPDGELLVRGGDVVLPDRVVRADVLVAFSESDENKAGTAALVRNGIWDRSEAAAELGVAFQQRHRDAAFGEQARGALGNRSDDGVAGYQYDRVFVNDGALDALPDKVHAFFADWLKNTQ